MRAVTLARCTLGLAVVALAPAARARPPFPQEVELRMACERAHVEATPHVLDATTCTLEAELARAGAATLVLEVAAIDLDDQGPDGSSGGTLTFDTRLAALTLGLDVNLGRERGEVGLELLWRASVLVGFGDTRTLAEPYPFTYGGLRLGVGWRWLELGGTPFPRPGDPRVAHLGYGIDAHHWVGSFGLGLFSLMAYDEGDDRFERRPTTFAAYAQIMGRIDDFRLGVRAILGAWQGLQLVLGWHIDVL